MFRAIRNLFTAKSAPPEPPAPLGTIADPSADLLSLLGSRPPAAGEPVGPRSSYDVPAVACAKRALRETIGTLPVKLLRRLDDGGKEPAPEHPAYALVHDASTAWESASSTRSQLVEDCINTGNGYAWVNKVNDRPVEIHRLPPGAVTVDTDDVTGEPSYRVTLKGGQRVYRFGEIIHLRGPSLDGVTGLPLIQIGAQAISFAALLQKAVALQFRNGLRPSMTFTPKSGLTDGRISNLVKLIRAQVAGENRGNALVLPEPVDISDGGAMTLVEAQAIEAWRFQTTLVSQIFRIPPHVLQEYGRATWGNIEHAAKDWLASLLPWLRQFEFEYAKTLLTRDERNEYVFEFVVEDLLRSDFRTRTDGYAKLIASRVLNPNEARAMEGRPGYEGGEKFENPNTSAPKPEPRDEGDQNGS